jgi:uncharacterized membrane protein HdeD (DUF308 family)
VALFLHLPVLDKTDLFMNQLAYNWWTVALRGALAIVVGLIAFFFPGVTLRVLVVMFGVFTLLEGMFLLVAGIRSRREYQRWWALILQGILSILIGIIAFAVPLATAIVLLYLIAAWAIVSGIIEISAAIQLRKQIEGEWALIMDGVVTILFGIFLIVLPGPGFLALIWMTGAFWLISGILLMILAFRLRKEDNPRLENAG